MTVGNIQAGEFHWLKVENEDEKTPSNFEVRPVLIIEVIDETVYYFYLTTRSGQPHQRKYRPEVKRWQQSGLKKKSYISVEDPIREADVNDFNNNSYIGEITTGDSLEMSKYMERLGYV